MRGGLAAKLPGVAAGASVRWALHRRALFHIVRDEHVVMPRGDSIFEAGDEVLAMVTPESEDEVRQLLTGT